MLYDELNKYRASGVGIRNAVKDMLQHYVDPETAASAVASELQDWRREKQQFLDTLSGDELVSQRKAVNNAVGYVNTCSKEILGYSIKCTSRKPHVYEIEAYAPKAKEEKSESSDENAELADAAAQELPLELVIAALIKQHGVEKFMEAVEAASKIV